MHNRLARGHQYKIPYNYISPHRDGVYLAINALPDSYLVYDIHSCGYYKAEKISGQHDLFSDLLRWDCMNRIVRTNLDSQQYIMGSEDKLSMKILQVHKRYQPELIFVVRSPVVIAAGHDIDAVLYDIKKKINTPLVKIPDRSVAEDFVTGYLDTLGSLFEHLNFPEEKTEEPLVAVAGYLFERNEGDHIGNVVEIKRMLVALGIRPGPFFLDGSPFSALRAWPKPSTILDLADGWDGAERLAARLSIEYVRTDLPIGIRGTEKWIRTLGESFGVEKRAESFIESELKELIPLLKWILPSHILGRSVMVFANRVVMVPLVEFLEEIGLRVTAVGNISESFSSGEATNSPLKGKYVVPPTSTEELTEYVIEAAAKGDADLIVGNSFVRQLVLAAKTAFVEMGYPSVYYHCLSPSPYLGFSGVKVLVEQIVNAFAQQALQTGTSPEHNNWR